MMARFAEFGIEISNDDPRLDNLIRVVKEREFEGWAFDSPKPVSSCWRAALLEKCRTISPSAVSG